MHMESTETPISTDDKKMNPEDSQSAISNEKPESAAAGEHKGMAQMEMQNESPQVETEGLAGEAAEEMHDSAKASNVKIEFPYSELVRAKIPKVFDVAEQVATDWVQDGQFESIPVENPLAQVLIGKSLRKAKDIEKEVVKVVESNPKLNEIKNQVVEKANVAKATIQILLKK